MSIMSSLGDFHGVTWNTDQLCLPGICGYPDVKQGKSDRERLRSSRRGRKSYRKPHNDPVSQVMSGISHFKKSETCNNFKYQSKHIFGLRVTFFFSDVKRIVYLSASKSNAVKLYIR